MYVKFNFTYNYIFLILKMFSFTLCNYVSYISSVLIYNILAPISKRNILIK